MKDAESVTQKLLLDFARGLTPSSTPLPAGVRIVDDRETALWLCELGERPDGIKEYLKGRDVSWSETLEHVSGRLGFRLDHFDVRLSTLDDYVYQLEEVWTPEADRLDLSDFNDTLVQYSTIILRHRILEDTEGLGEVLYRVLCAGGLPCGCEGEWPSEPVIVYWPHQIPPKFE